MGILGVIDFSWLEFTKKTGFQLVSCGSKNTLIWSWFFNKHPTSDCSKDLLMLNCFLIMQMHCHWPWDIGCWPLAFVIGSNPITQPISSCRLLASWTYLNVLPKAEETKEMESSKNRKPPGFISQWIQGLFPFFLFQPGMYRLRAEGSFYSKTLNPQGSMELEGLFFQCLWNDFYGSWAAQNCQCINIRSSKHFWF